MATVKAMTFPVAVWLLLLGAFVPMVLALSVAPSLVSTGSTGTQPTNRDDSLMNEVKRVMMERHASEVAGGKAAFGTNDPDVLPTTATTWNDEDFLGRNLGENTAGTDAQCLPRNGHMVFESKAPVLTQEECEAIIHEAQSTIAHGLRTERESAASNHGDETPQRVNAISNSQLGEARLSQMPQTRAWLKQSLSQRFYPLLKNRFGVDDLVLYDGLVMGHQAPTRSQPIHRDASLLTLNVALSAPTDYVGGGTYVEALDEILTIGQGHLLCHAGSAMHAGNAISSGERWVFVLFLLGEGQPQLARRCHAEAIERLREGDTERAETLLKTGLASVAPHDDHLLHTTLGRLQIRQATSSSQQPLQSFARAKAAYPICPNAGVSASQLLMDRNRPRAALRKLDQVLGTVIGDRDRLPTAQNSLRAVAYGARRDAARCALVCADQGYRKTHSSDDNDEKQSQPRSSWASWTLHHLPTAIDRLQTCLAAAPNEPTLLGMLDHAEYLLAKAHEQ